MDKTHTTARDRAPTVVPPVAFPSLIVWTLILVTLSWWPRPPRLPEGLPWVVETFYNPRVGFLVLAGLTVLLGRSARHDRQKTWAVLGSSMMMTAIYIFIL